ncbi:HAD family hydrolase [Paraburkholderia sp. SOS3]|uniref:HAD family hydrolase n=1 Tax=Paraburkholderia sp. SOS3 TaxID=1926494 RepID=UPI0009475D1A|nr:HAD hydrolase family protein [Paraburkholderia sp. SOS3]APR35244.1 hypothetical protein BTO02_07160 [Paraburkholderia sp. SOS3]
MSRIFIGLDRDGTIDMPGLPAPARLVEQLRGMQQDGAKVFIASGKSYDVLKEVCAGLGLEPWMYCCENGGHIVIPHTGREYVFSEGTDLAFFIAHVGELALPPSRDEPKRSIWSKKFGGESLAAKRVIDEFVARHGLRLSVFAYPDGDGGLDVVPDGIDKSNLLRLLPEDAVVHFFGDGENDLGIMRSDGVVPHTVANGKRAVKQCVAEKGGHIADEPAGYGVCSVLAQLRAEWRAARVAGYMLPGLCIGGLRDEPRARNS